MSLLMWMRAIRDHRPKPGPRSARYPVLWGLALRMRKDGSGFVSMQTLAEDVEWGESTVRRHIKWARDTGYLLRTRRGHRLGDGTAIASEYRLTQPLTGEQLTEVSTAQMGILNRSDDGSQPLTGERTRESSTRESSSSVSPRVRATLTEAGVADDEIDEILERIQVEHHPRNLAAWLATVAGNGDLAPIISEVREQRTKAAWPAERDAFTAELADYPPCPHGQPGGNIMKPDGIEVGWVSCVGCRVNARRSA
jgi:biotin operon repressor